MMAQAAGDLSAMFIDGEEVAEHSRGLRAGEVKGRYYADQCTDWSGDVNAHEPAKVGRFRGHKAREEYSGLGSHEISNNYASQAE
jgi:hypothetical protein